MTQAVRVATNPYLVFEIRRDHLMEDTLEQVSLSLKDLKKPLKIKYVGGGEEGVDMGGVQKEFFQLIMERVFDVRTGMFEFAEETDTFWINGSSLESEREFELVGILIGLAIYNGVILDMHLPLVLYKKLLGCVPRSNTPFFQLWDASHFLSRPPVPAPSRPRPRLTLDVRVFP